MRSRDDGGLEQVAAVLREDLAAAGLAHLVAGAADPLQAARDRARRLHLHDEVDRAHVDAELQRRGRDDGLERAGLQPVLHLSAAARARASRGARARGPRSASSFSREASRSARRRAFVNTIVERCERISSSSCGWIEGQIEARWSAFEAGPLRGSSRGAAHLRHVLDGDDHLDLHALAVAGVDDRDGARRPGSFVPAEEAGDLVERALRGRQADPLRRRVGEALEPFEREREVRARASWRPARGSRRRSPTGRRGASRAPAR